MTSAERSTFLRAWIFPFAVTLATRSIFSTLAVVTRATSLSLRRMNPMATKVSTMAPRTPRMIFVFFDIDFPPVTALESPIFLRGAGVKVRHLARLRARSRADGEKHRGWCAQEDLTPQPPDP